MAETEQKSFKVTVTRTKTESTEIGVTAQNAEEAADTAVSVVRHIIDGRADVTADQLDWELVDETVEVEDVASDVEET